MYTSFTIGSHDKIHCATNAQRTSRTRVPNRISVQNSSPCCRINAGKAIYNIPHQSILFIESEHKKTVIHLTNQTICVSLPLYRLRQELPESTFVQTHRSFIVNLKNAACIDKSHSPWVISFFDSEQMAFVGRSFQKNILQIIHVAQASGAKDGD